jgi:hypothetical protein
MHPANVPDPLAGGSAPGLVRSLLFLALYVLCLVGLVLYLRWKLPRSGAGDAGARQGEDESSPPPRG